MSKVISYKLYVLSIPEKVAELIWLSQILALILYTITTNPLKMQYMTNTSIICNLHFSIHPLLLPFSDHNRELRTKNREISIAVSRKLLIFAVEEET